MDKIEILMNKHRYELMDYMYGLLKDKSEIVFDKPFCIYETCCGDVSIHGVSISLNTVLLKCRTDYGKDVTLCCQDLNYEDLLEIVKQIKKCII